MSDAVKVARELARGAQKVVLGLASAPNGDVILQRDARTTLTRHGIVSAVPGSTRYRLTVLGQQVAQALRPCVR